MAMNPPATPPSDKDRISQLELQNLQLRAELLTVKLTFQANAAGHAQEIMPYLKLELQQVSQLLQQRGNSNASDV